MVSKASKFRIVPAPILLAVSFLVGAIVNHFFSAAFLPGRGYLHVVIAVVLCVASLIIGVSAVREFHRHNTPTNPYKATTVLVTSGIFRYTRNPMYLGFVLLACGIAVGLNSIAYLVAAALLATLLRVLVISHEEQLMAESFGERFRSYCGSTRRWL
jgi:protein-S-isoprenylcysteine O-methyltransferase Ste14